MSLGVCPTDGRTFPDPDPGLTVVVTPQLVNQIKYSKAKKKTQKSKELTVLFATSVPSLPWIPAQGWNHGVVL